MKKIYYLLIFLFILTSCQSIKDAGKIMRNEKVKTTDEFLVKKRKPLVLPPDYNELPTPDSVKRENSNVLDLYSGVGSFGLECISRGADNVTFVENNPKTLKILKRNIIKLSNKNAVVFESKIENFLQANNKKKYEIIFFDPPFSDEEFILNLESLRKNKLFKQNHLIIIHREKKSNDNLKNILKVIKIKQYGRSKIIFGNFT